MRNRTRATSVAIVLMLAACCSSANAWTGEVSWPTFYRAGPGRNYTVLDELDRGKMLEVLSCKDGWCEVRDEDSIGYTEQEWIVQPGALPGKPQVSGLDGCVQSRVTGSGYTGGLEYQFCPRSDQVSVPSGAPAPGSVSPGTK